MLALYSTPLIGGGHLEQQLVVYGSRFEGNAGDDTAYYLSLVEKMRRYHETGLHI